MRNVPIIDQRTFQVVNKALKALKVNKVNKNQIRSVNANKKKMNSLKNFQI